MVCVAKRSSLSEEWRLQYSAFPVSSGDSFLHIPLLCSLLLSEKPIFCEQFWNHQSVLTVRQTMALNVWMNKPWKVLLGVALYEELSFPWQVFKMSLLYTLKTVVGDKFPRWLSGIFSIVPSQCKGLSFYVFFLVEWPFLLFIYFFKTDSFFIWHTNLGFFVIPLIFLTIVLSSPATLNVLLFEKKTYMIFKLFSLLFACDSHGKPGSDNPAAALVLSCLEISFTKLVVTFKVGTQKSSNKFLSPVKRM